MQLIACSRVSPRTPQGQAPRLEAQIFSPHQQPPRFLNCKFFFYQSKDSVEVGLF